MRREDQGLGTFRRRHVDLRRVASALCPGA
ncbi:putative leader peptide [Actinacidiphila yeochonensis]